MTIGALGIRRTDFTLTSERYKNDKKLQKHAARQRKEKARGGRGGGCTMCCGSRQEYARHEDGEPQPLAAGGGGGAAAGGAGGAGGAGEAGAEAAGLGTLHCSHWEPEPSCRPGGPEANIPCLVYLHGNCGCRVEALDVLQVWTRLSFADPPSPFLFDTAA